MGPVMAITARSLVLIMFEFINDNDYDCGQAAAATFLAHYGMIPGNQKLLSVIEKEFPPDIVFGWCGTSPGQVKKICEHWGLKIKETTIITLPMIVLIQDGELGGHWAVLDSKTHLTNYGCISDEEFLTLWNGVIPKLAGFNNKGFISADN